VLDGEIRRIPGVGQILLFPLRFLRRRRPIRPLIARLAGPLTIGPASAALGARASGSPAARLCRRAFLAVGLRSIFACGGGRLAGFFRFSAPRGLRTGSIGSRLACCTGSRCFSLSVTAGSLALALALRLALPILPLSIRPLTTGLIVSSLLLPFRSGTGPTAAALLPTSAGLAAAAACRTTSLAAGLAIGPRAWRRLPGVFLLSIGPSRLSRLALPGGLTLVAGGGLSGFPRMLGVLCGVLLGVPFTGVAARGLSRGLPPALPRLRGRLLPVATGLFPGLTPRRLRFSFPIRGFLAGGFVPLACTVRAGRTGILLRIAFSRLAFMRTGFAPLGVA